MADSTGELSAIVTAIGGVVVSMATVWLNSKKQASNLGDTNDEVEKLRAEVRRLRRIIEQDGGRRARRALAERLEDP